MLNIKSRLHLQNHNEPNGTAYIIGEKHALRALGEALIKTSKSVVGLDTIELYTSDGHKYEIVITCDVSEEEWQELPTPYDKKHNVNKLQIINAFNEVKK
jgi:hypothetical protein